MSARRFCLTTLLLLLVATSARSQELGIPVGTKAPGAQLETLDGKRVDLAQYLGGKPTLIEFWAAWCTNCKALEPKLQALHRRYGDRLRMIAVAVSVNQSVQRARLYSERHGLPMTVLYDRKGDASVAYDAPATSYIVLVDAAGNVVYTGLGADQDLDAVVRKALKIVRIEHRGLDRASGI
jgi:thiol-disulfide isomerase/thioredoxin